MGTGSALLERLPDTEDANVVLVAMLTPSRAVDLFLGDFQRKSRSRKGRSVASYRRVLDKFTDQMASDMDVTDITSDDCRRFLDRYARLAMGTQATYYATLNSFFKWLYLQQRIKKNPLDHVPKVRRLHPDTLDVTTVSTADVPRLIAAAKGWTERLAVAIPAFTGARRSAVAELTLDDYNQDTGHLRFREKGGKVIWKPIPHELRQLLDAAIAQGAISDTKPYLVPAEGGLVKQGPRDDRVIWRAVKKVGERAGVDIHVHALRAAFATFYLEQNTGDVEALKELMGHESIATTQTYLRRLDRQAAMERVRSLSWGIQTGQLDGPEIPANSGETFSVLPSMGAGGFEPPFPDIPHGYRAGTQPGQGAQP